MVTRLVTEEPIQFECRANRLYGILHRPEPGSHPQVAVMMVVGGPQTRVGSHRLYVQLARFLCRRGIIVFRFDYEGLGDSEGDFVGARQAEASIQAGMACLQKHLSDHRKNVIWSLCDGCAPSISYAANNQQAVDGLILCNPYVFSGDRDLSRAILKNYYLRRLVSPDFWIRLLSLKIKYRESRQSLLETLKKSRVPLKTDADSDTQPRQGAPAELFTTGLMKYPHPIRFILSTDDLAAQRFADFLNTRREIKRLAASDRLASSLIDGADHTFTQPEKKSAMFTATLHAIHEIIDTSRS